MENTVDMSRIFLLNYRQCRLSIVVVSTLEGIMVKKSVCILLLVFLPSLASGQLKSQNGVDLQTVLRYGLNPIGLVSGSLLDPNRFHISQSYSISFMNFGSQSISQAMYLNTMTYQISTPLSFSLQWGLMMNKNLGTGGLGIQSNSPFNNGLFISGAQLRYAPSANTEFKLELRQYPNQYFYGTPFHGR